MSECTHDWRLDKTERLTYWHYPVHRSFFRKRLVVQDGLFKGGVYEMFGWARRWYCTKCRVIEWTEERRSFDEVLKQGRAVYDYEARKYLMPDEADVPA